MVAGSSQQSLQQWTEPSWASLLRSNLTLLLDQFHEVCSGSHRKYDVTNNQITASQIQQWFLSVWSIPSQCSVKLSLELLLSLIFSWSFSATLWCLKRLMLYLWVSQAENIDSSVSQTVISSSSGSSAVKSEQTFSAFPEHTAINITSTHQPLLWAAPEGKGQLQGLSQLSQWSFFSPRTEM